MQIFRFAQDGNVEIRAVMPYGINSRIGERCPEILRHGFRYRESQTFAGSSSIA